MSYPMTRAYKKPKYWANGGEGGKKDLDKSSMLVEKHSPQSIKQNRQTAMAG
jgi:hypothetical protein